MCLTISNEAGQNGHLHISVSNENSISNGFLFSSFALKKFRISKVDIFHKLIWYFTAHFNISHHKHKKYIHNTNFIYSIETVTYTILYVHIWIMMSLLYARKSLNFFHKEEEKAVIIVGCIVAESFCYRAHCKK